MESPATLEMAKPVLHCHLCQKPFTQESSHARHVKYCRKAQTRPRIRNKACQACSASKTKCTFQRPCRRCDAKGLECKYEEPRNEAAELFKVASKPMLPFSPDLLSLPLPNPHGGGAGMGVLDDPRIEEVLQLPDAGLSMYDDLLGLTPTQNDPAFSMPQQDEDAGKASEEVIVGSVQYLLEDLRPKAFFLPPRAVLNCSIPWVGTGGSSYVVYRSLQIPMSERTTSLTRLAKSDPVAQNSARMILQVMRAYPYMMLRRETFPPFIHPHWHRQGPSVLPGPLASCMSIASLFASRTSETSAFLWEMVMRESQKCVDEMKTLSDYDLLAAIQAHIIYIIMRFVDGSSQPPDMNMQLVISHKVLCNLFVERYSDTAGQYQAPLAYSNWEEWIYAESKVRTVVVFFLISRIVSVYTSAWCSATARFGELPLCSAKGLWEAKTAPMWASEHAAYTQAPGSTLLTVGELVDAQGTSDNPIKAQSLDSWNARADSLGTLLNIATMNLMKI